MLLDRSDFREAMARLGAAVNIITTSGPEGDTGFTASAVCSVTDDPATLCVCMNRASSQFLAFRDARSLCVNILGAEGERLSRIFAGQEGMAMAARFEAAHWTRLATGAPVLESAVAALDCTIAQSFSIGTHQVFFCEVKAIRLNAEPSGLVYHRRRYHPLAASPA
jgi:flavin reductase